MLDDKDRIFPYGLDYYKIDDLLKYCPENKEALLVQNIYLMWAKIYYDKMLCYKPKPTASIEDL